MLGVVLTSLGTDRRRIVEVSTRAFHLSDRLSGQERVKVLADYYYNGLGGIRKAAETYEMGIARYPEGGFWNNLGVCYGDLGEYEKAVNAYRDAVQSFGPTEINTANLIIAAISIGDLETGRMGMALRRENFPDSPRNLYTGPIHSQSLFAR